MRFRRLVQGALGLLLVLPVPALIAPFVAEHPTLWAYRFYHPGMYRYPLYVATVLKRSDAQLQGQPRLRQSMEVLRMLIHN